MPAPHFFDHSQGCRIVASKEVHSGNAAVRNIRPKCQSMLFAVILDALECFNRFIETIHVGENMCPSHSGGCCRYRVITAHQSGLVVNKRFFISVQTVIEIAERDFERCEVRSSWAFSSAARALSSRCVASSNRLRKERLSISPTMVRPASPFSWVSEKRSTARSKKGCASRQRRIVYRTWARDR
jgi:hypothetical protein